ncbi:dehydrogenase [Rhodobacteraceae bacterium RKSG542]|uniref:zinc-binding dehydrogenase n=1 Tax=Pseudovibrio flavus TaxID=2529854 RepID=UPI0012BBFF3A|nr:zinc-binding dehydrogenase [Pseudovibrio flavus]MTI19387.1 dehydrogenase [Pseudovibrio flavus]
MKAITYQQATDTFRFSEIDVPKLESEFDVLVKVIAVGLNPVDTKVNLWKGMVADMDDTFVGGLDVSGQIVEVGAAVTAWKVGDTVLYHGNMRRKYGGFAEYAVHDSRSLIAHPKVLPEIAAATPCAGWTAYRALVARLDIMERKSLFVAGGSGGVGGFALQLAKLFGMKTIIASSSAANHDYVESLGASHVIDYRDEDVVSRVFEITEERGVDVSLDCVGGENQVICASVLRYEGQMVELVDTCDLNKYPQAFLRGIGVHQLSLGSGHVNGAYGRTTIVNAGKAVSRLLEEGRIHVPRLEVITLEEIGDALMNMRSQRTVGKIVAQVAEF